MWQRISAPARQAVILLAAVALLMGAAFVNAMGPWRNAEDKLREMGLLHGDYTDDAHNAAHDASDAADDAAGDADADAGDAGSPPGGDGRSKPLSTADKWFNEAEKILYGSTRQIVLATS
jgi:hypothetical protein